MQKDKLYILPIQIQLKNVRIAPFGFDLVLKRNEFNNVYLLPVSKNANMNLEYLANAFDAQIKHPNSYGRVMIPPLNVRIFGKNVDGTFAGLLGFVIGGHGALVHRVDAFMMEHGVGEAIPSSVDLEVHPTKENRKDNLTNAKEGAILNNGGGYVGRKGHF